MQALPDYRMRMLQTREQKTGTSERLLHRSSSQFSFVLQVRGVCVNGMESIRWRSTAQHSGSVLVVSTSFVRMNSHINSGFPSDRGLVVFQYCSRPGPSNDITRVDEAPTGECDSGDANWARLASVPVDAFGNAELEFCCPMITPTIGFRFRYLGQGSDILRFTISSTSPAEGPELCCNHAGTFTGIVAGFFTTSKVPATTFVGIRRFGAPGEFGTDLVDGGISARHSC